MAVIHASKEKLDPSLTALDTHYQFTTSTGHFPGTRQGLTQQGTHNDSMALPNNPGEAYCHHVRHSFWPELNLGGWAVECNCVKPHT